MNTLFGKSMLENRDALCQPERGLSLRHVAEKIDIEYHLFQFNIKLLRDK